MLDHCTPILAVAKLTGVSWSDLGHGAYPLLLTGAVLAIGLIGLAPVEGRAQTRPEPPRQTVTRDEAIARAWELRGVVLGDARPMAVLEDRSSEREQIFRIGDVLTAGVVVVRIAEDRVILGVEGRPVTLRLGHGGGLRTPRARVAPAGNRPPTWIPGRRR